MKEGRTPTPPDPPRVLLQKARDDERLAVLSPAPGVLFRDQQTATPEVLVLPQRQVLLQQARLRKFGG